MLELPVTIVQRPESAVERQEERVLWRLSDAELVALAEAILAAVVKDEDESLVCIPEAAGMAFGVPLAIIDDEVA